MGTLYTSQAAAGYNASPPPDDGSQGANNQITWGTTIKAKLADPIKALADAINSQLTTALDLSPRAISTPDSAVASDHWRTLQVTGTTTITLSDAATMTNKYVVGIANLGVGTVTVTRATGANTVNGTAADFTLAPKQAVMLGVNQGATGYNILAHSLASGAGINTIQATTSVVTPLVASGSVGVELALGLTGEDWGIVNSAGMHYFRPATDNTQQLGGANNRISTVFTPIIDSGSTGSLSLKTNNGQTQVLISDAGGTAVNFVQLSGALTGNPVNVLAGGTDPNIGIQYESKGTGFHNFYSDAGGALQFQVLRTVSANRNITVTGSNGGNPTIGTTAGSLAITPSVVMASSLVWGTGIATFGMIIKRKTADESVTSSAALQDDDHLLFPIAANEEWTATFEVTVTYSSAGGYKNAITVPAGATLRASSLFTDPGGSPQMTTSTTSGGALINTLPAGTSSAMVRVTVWVLNGATPGNVVLQWAQSVSNGTPTVSVKGSYLIANRSA
jgi:hypothetical protein